VSLAAFRENSAVLLAFFPLDFTSTCTAELCDFSSEYHLFEGAGVAVLPISVDSTESLAEYRAKHSMKTHLLSDFRRDVARSYGVLNEDRYFANRAYFLVDKAGRIRWKHVELVNRDKRTNAEILTEIARLST
jgi:peroxiredoxin